MGSTAAQLRILRHSPGSSHGKPKVHDSHTASHSPTDVRIADSRVCLLLLLILRLVIVRPASVLLIRGRKIRDQPLAGPLRVVPHPPSEGFRVRMKASTAFARRSLLSCPENHTEVTIIGQPVLTIFQRGPDDMAEMRRGVMADDESSDQRGAPFIDQADELSHGLGEVGNLLCKGGTRIKLGRSDPVQAERLAPTTVHARADWALNGGCTGFVQGIDRRDVRHEQSS
jgi:hypothetical protein